MRFLNAANGFAGFARWFCGSKFDPNWIGRRVMGVRSIVRVPPDTLADSKVKKHPLEYGLAKVFLAPSGGNGLARRYSLHCFQSGGNKLNGDLPGFRFSMSFKIKRMRILIPTTAWIGNLGGCGHRQHPNLRADRTFAFLPSKNMKLQFAGFQIFDVIQNKAHVNSNPHNCMDWKSGGCGQTTSVPEKTGARQIPTRERALANPSEKSPVPGNEPNFLARVGLDS